MVLKRVARQPGEFSEFRVTGCDSVPRQHEVAFSVGDGSIPWYWHGWRRQPGEFYEFWVTGGDSVSDWREVAFLVAEGWVAWYWHEWSRRRAMVW